MSNINWNETYTNLSPKLLGICRRYIKDIATAEDIVQDSFIVAIQKENSLKDINSLYGWLSRIVINMAIHHLKETKKINFSASNNYDLVDNTTLMNTLEIDNKSTILASDIDRNDILEAIDSLTENHKSVFNMYVIDQFSHNEIAKTLTISVGTSKSSLSRARKSIQSFLLEKIKGKPVDKKKKRFIAFLLFFGLENRMFANFYQSRFHDFEILSKNSFSLTPKNISVPNNFIGLSKIVSVSKIAIVSIGIFSLVGVGIYFMNVNSTTINSTKKQSEIAVENKPETIINQSIVTNLDSIKNKISTLKTISDKELSKEKNSTQNSISKTDEEVISAVKKDSSQIEAPKVVVIKKQIIKRDTIYVTK